jgi:hypothetical protein
MINVSISGKPQFKKNDIEIRQTFLDGIPFKWVGRQLLTHNILY